VIAPDFGEYDPIRGPLTSGVGRYEGLGQIDVAAAFQGEQNVSDVRYFVTGDEDLEFMDRSQVGNRGY
jgi:hypothetical protein